MGAKDSEKKAIEYEQKAGDVLARLVESTDDQVAATAAAGLASLAVARRLDTIYNMIG